MSYDALSRGRYTQPHQIYSITTVVHEREPLFLDFASARRLIRELRKLHEQGHVISLAWVLMPDHLHWMLQLTESWPLANVVKTLKARSAMSVNRVLGRSGSVWQRGFYDRASRRGDDMRLMARYMVANPLRAGLAEDIGQYPHWDCIWMQNGDRGNVVE